LFDRRNRLFVVSLGADMTAAMHIDRPLRPTPARPALRTSRVRPSSVRPSRVRPSAATYRRRRAIVGAGLAVFVAVGLVTAHDVLAGSGGVPASAAASQPALGAVPASVVARPGDTLWSIADELRGDVPITRYVDTLVDLNGGASIEAGQTIVLP
jgi:Tfp pilus assembly protein FimV